jgi:hypothetical protein
MSAAAPPLNLPDIPEFLTRLVRWVLWRIERRVNKETGEVIETKPPISYHTSKKCDITDPRNWADFAKVNAALANSAAWDGCGIALGIIEELAEVVFGLDADACIDEDGATTPWAMDFLSAASSYAERSPSGRGIKAIARIPLALLPVARKLLDIAEGDKEQARTKTFGPRPSGGGHAPSVQLFLMKRYFTITGQHWTPSPREVRLLTVEDLTLLGTLFGPNPSRHRTNGQHREWGAIRNDDDAEPEDAALRAKLDAECARNAKLRGRWEGSIEGLHDTSRSGRDMSVAALLIAARWNKGETRAALRLFPHGKSAEEDERYFERIWERSAATPGLTRISGYIESQDAQSAEWLSHGGAARRGQADATNRGNGPTSSPKAPPGPEPEPQPKLPPQPSPDDEPPQRHLRKGAFPHVKAALNFFNKRYMLVTDGGRAWIYEQRYDRMLKRRFFAHTRPADFRLMFANREVLVGTNDAGEPVYANAAAVWLAHPDRRQFLRGFVFYPDEPPGPDHAEETYNLWQGFNVKPKPGSWELLKQHLMENVCQDSILHFDYLLDWMASLMQHPNRQGEICIVLIGEEGVGKSIVGRILRHILGQHAFIANHAKQLTGNFNAHLRDIVFLLGDEAFYAGDKAHESILKSLITEPTLPIEAKYRDTVNAPNFLHMMLTANPGWVIPVSVKGRRFVVYSVGTDHMRDYPYFAAIMQEMETGGYEAMLHELLARDISAFNVRDFPDSEGLQEQKQRSLKTELAWWLDVLHRGYVWPSKLGLEDHFAEWHEEVTTELLYASYNEYAKAHGERRPMPRTLFGQFIGDVGGRPRRLSNEVVGEHLTDVENDGHIRREAKLVIQPRPPGYHLGSLDAARAAFDAHTKLDIQWEP